MFRALSSKDIKGYFNGKVKVILYNEIGKYRTIDELLNPYGRVIMLYFWKAEPNYYGHWISCFRNCNNNIEVFDSFGTFIDDTLNKISLNFRKEHNIYEKHLTKLLYDSGKIIEYNDKQLQDKKTSTCGRWCIYRLYRDDLTIEQFQKLFDIPINNDKKIIKLVV